MTLAWWDSARCKGDPAFLDNTVTSEMLETCEMCPVRELCLTSAMKEETGHDNGMRWGVRGGLTAHERFKLAYGHCGVCGEEHDGVICLACRPHHGGPVPEPWRRTCIQCGLITQRMNGSNKCGDCRKREASAS